MNESQLLRIVPFDVLPVVPLGKSDSLLSPHDPEYHPLVCEATDVPVVRDLLTDPDLVPQGAYQDEFGMLRAVFWQRLYEKSPRC